MFVIIKQPKVTIALRKITQCFNLKCGVELHVGETALLAKDESLLLSHLQNQCSLLLYQLSVEVRLNT